MIFSYMTAESRKAHQGVGAVVGSALDDEKRPKVVKIVGGIEGGSTTANEIEVQIAQTGECRGAGIAKTAAEALPDTVQIARTK